MFLDFDEPVPRKRPTRCQCGDDLPGTCPGVENCQFSGHEEEPTYRFEMVYCSACGEGFGPGNEGFAMCKYHAHLTPVEA